MSKPIANKLLDEIDFIKKDSLEIYKDNQFIIDVLKITFIRINGAIRSLENEVIAPMREQYSKPLIQIMKHEHFTHCILTKGDGTWENCPNEQCKKYIKEINKYYQQPTPINDLFFSDKIMSNFIAETRDEILKKQKENKDE